MLLKGDSNFDPQMHGKRILKLLQKIFSWLPLATVIDQKVLVLHGGISDLTDLSLLARLDRHNVRLRPPFWKSHFYHQWVESLLCFLSMSQL